MVGKYVPESDDKLNIPVGIKRNELVSRFINSMRLGLTNKSTRIAIPSASLRAMQPVI